MSTDAIVILKEDHKRVRALFKRFQPQAAQGRPTTLIARLQDTFRSDA